MATAVAASPTVSLPAAARDLTPNSKGDMVVASMALGGVAFISIQSDGLEGPQVRKDWPTLSAEALPSGNFLLAGRFGDLRLVSIAGEGSVEERGAWKTEGVPTDLLVADGRLFVAGGAAGVLVYDWQREDEAPRLRGRFPFVDYSKEVKLDGTTLFLADNRETGLQILDVQDPLRPRRLAVEARGFVDSVDFLNDLAAISSRANGAYLFDVKDPTNPEEVLRIAGIGRPDGRFSDARRVVFSPDGRLLVCEGPAGGRLFQITRTDNKYSATLLKDFPGDTQGGVSAGAFLPDGRLLLARDRGKIELVK